MDCKQCGAKILGFWSEGFVWDEWAVCCENEECDAVVASENRWKNLGTPPTEFDSCDH